MRGFWMVALIAALLSGCGGKYEIAPVSGKVTVDGQPAENLTVSFEPIGSADNPNPGFGSLAKTDAQGAYSLKTVPEQKDGAIVGEHRVRIMYMDGGGAGVTDEGPEDDKAMLKEALQGMKKRSAAKQLPAKYNMQTELTFKVPEEGTDAANFDLSTK